MNNADTPPPQAALRVVRGPEPERLLPQNVEAEAGVLGSLLIDPSKTPRVAQIVKADDFYREAHRVIFAAMVDLARNAVPADLITLTDEIARRGKLDDAGGLSYIGELSNQVPTSANVEYYARIVERTAVMRRLIHAAGQIAAIAYNEPEATAALDHAQQLITTASERAAAHEEETPFIFPLLGAREAEEMQPAQGILGDLLYESSIALLYAKSGRWKSFLAGAMGYAIATGGALFGRKAMQGPVVYIAAEGARNIGKRLTALRLQHQITGEVPFYLLGRAANLLDATLTAQLITDLEAQLPATPALIIIDTVARSMNGGDENAAKDINAIFDAAQRMKELWCCCVLLVHHDGKEGAKGARGSSALYANADTVLRITGQDEKTVILPGDLVKLECEKSKDDTPFDPIPFTAGLTKWARESGETCSSLIILPADSPAAQQKDLNANSQLALDLLLETPGMSATDWWHATDLKKTSFYDARHDLDVRGYLRKDLTTQNYFPSAFALRSQVGPEVGDRSGAGPANRRYGGPASTPP